MAAMTSAKRGKDVPTERIRVSAPRAYARARTLALSTPPDDVHRIAPKEEFLVDAAELRARFSRTDEAQIEQALDAHALLKNGGAAPRDGARSTRSERPVGLGLVVTLALLALSGLALGVGAALAS